MSKFKEFWKSRLEKDMDKYPLSAKDLAGMGLRTNVIAARSVKRGDVLLIDGRRFKVVKVEEFKDPKGPKGIKVSFEGGAYGGLYYNGSVGIKVVI